MSISKLKQTIDEKKPSYERQLALLFLLAMPRTIEERMLAVAYEKLKEHNITDLAQTQLTITTAFLGVALEQAVKMGKEILPDEERKH